MRLMIFLIGLFSLFVGFSPLGNAQNLPPVVTDLLFEGGENAVLRIHSTDPISLDIQPLEKDTRLVISLGEVLFHVSEIPQYSSPLLRIDYGLSKKTGRIDMTFDAPISAEVQSYQENLHFITVVRIQKIGLKSGHNQVEDNSSLASLAPTPLSRAQGTLASQADAPFSQAEAPFSQADAPFTSQNELPFISRNELPLITGAGSSPLKARESDESRPKFRVILDAGHGGIDPGAKSDAGVLEKDLTLSYALSIKSYLQTQGYDVLLTRDEDVFLPLRERVQFASDNEADIFISLHADSFANAPLRTIGDVRGASLYTYSVEATDIETEDYAKRENAADALAGLEIEDIQAVETVTTILDDLRRRETAFLSKQFSNILLTKLSSVLTFHKRPEREARFTVLSHPYIPSLLLEIGFMSSAQDLEKLNSSVTKQEVAVQFESALRVYRDALIAARR